MTGRPSAVLENLSPERRALLLRKLRQKQQHKAAAEAIPRQAERRRFPLSFGQESIYLHQQLAPGNVAFILNQTLRLAAPIDRHRLELALGMLVERHEILRTALVIDEGEPAQVLVPLVPRLPLVDLGGLPRTVGEAEARRLARRQGLQPFDLATPPLFRMTLLRLAADDHLLAFSIHHAITDEWSNHVLFQELTLLYDAGPAANALMQPAVQYGDFAAWQRRRSSAERREEQLDYWRRTLEGEPPILRLPTDRQRPNRRIFESGRRSFAWPRSLAERLAAHSKRSAATPFMILLAAYQALLCRISGTADVWVGSVFGNRQRRELQRTVGFLADTVVLRADVAGDPSFEELLDRVRRIVVGAFAHQEVPFETVARALDGGAERRSWYQTMLVLLSLPATPASGEDGGFAVSAFGPSGELQVLEDLNIYLYDQDSELGGNAEYNAEIFDASTVDRLLRHYTSLVEGLLREPGLALSQHPLLTRGERHQLLEWNATHRSWPRELIFHRLFERQAEATPEAIALCYEGQAMSYAELGRRARALAGRLQALGVGPESRVGICLERSPEMMVAVVGVLQSGAAYVPLDADYPRDRLARVFESAGMMALVTRRDLGDRLPVFTGNTIFFDGDADFAAAGEPFTPPPLDPDHPVYVIFTSGSTGQPKGILLPHGVMANLLEWHFETLYLGQRILQFSTFNFDVSPHEMFAAWGSGATLEIIPEALRRDVPALAELLVERRIDKAILPVVVLQQLAELLRAGAGHRGARALPMALREMTTTGEQQQITRAVRDFFEQLPDCRLHNHYGPAETHVVNAEALEHRGSARWPSHPPIGPPITNARIHLVDRHFDEIPIGHEGELLIAGECLARGYLDQPALTAERFGPNLFAKTPGERLYRTGDLARYRPSGSVEYLGRIDHQVKIHGYRIEIEEVEGALAAHPEVLETVVMAREDRVGERRLVAYFVAEPGASPTTSDLARFVGERLPPFMVPAVFQHLERLQLNPNGKVDRRNLPVPGRERPELAEAYEAPNGSREQVLAEVWCRVLGLDRVGRHDHFLELGGDSVSSLRIAVEARRRGLIFEVRELLEHPSIAELASLVREGEPEPAQAPADFGSEHSHPLSPMQAGILFHALQGDGSSYLEHVECALEEAVDVDALQRAWQRVVARHPALRTSFRWHEVIEPVQTVHAEVELPWSVCDLRGLAPEKQERLVAHHVRHAAGCQSFDLARPPLLRWMLWRLGEARWRLLVTYHHLIADGWSSAVVLEELETCYRAIVRGERPVLGDSLPFWEILEWRRRRDRPAATAFWRDILEGVTGPTRLGLERRRPKEGWSLTELRLSEPATEALRELARRRRWTLNTLLQGGFAILISRYAGEEEALFGNVVSGRPAELSGIDTAVGLFIDNVPLRTAASRGARLGPWLDELQRGQFAAAAHEHLGLAEIQRLSPLPRSQRLFDYFLVFASYPAGAGSWRRRDWPSLDTGYPLYLLVEPESRLRLRVVASAAVFAQVEVERFLGHLEVLLESLPVEPEVALGELPLLPPAERQQLLAEWNDTRIDWPEEPGFVQRFAAVAARYPDRVAVALGDEQRSYGRLAADAGRTARRLHERGLGRGTIVALLAERGPDFLTAVLGIVSVGGAYLPIDPSHPRRRQRQIIAASGAAMLLTRRTLWPEEDGVPGGVELGLAYLEELGLGDLDIPAVDEALESTAQPEDLAYVIYTSGSTGVPKGVMVEHRGMANHLDIKIFDLGIGETDVVLQNASQTFDVSVWQFLVALLAGGRVLVVADEVALDSARLLEAVETGSATVIEVVPSLLTYLLAEVDESQRRPSLRRLRWLVPTGEALSPELADRWLEHYPQIPLLNAYGPTECSDDVSHHRIDRPLPPDTVHVPVGRSLPNLQLYVLDRWLQPLPVGPPGELFVGGRGVGRGYLGQPRKTALTFLPDPFAAEGSRLYRTGDLACWLPDGSVEFRGRIDHQLKVRGFRIEPGEIEAALASHDDLRAAVVTALAAGSEAAASQGVRLVGYVVPAGDTAPSAAELRAWLGERLPAYMVPGELVVLDELPLLSSGKVDRRALPVPGTMVRSDEPTAPRTPLEELLVALWAEVLGLETVGIRADFFDLGGHSLAAVRLVARVSAAQGIELTLADLFDSPTVEALAALIEGRTAADKAVQVPPLEPVDRGLYPDGLPASFAQRRLWFLDKLEPGSAVYNVPFELRLAGRLEVSGLASALARIYRRHEVLRTVLREAGGEPRQWIAASEVAPLPIVDLSRLAQPAREGELARWSEREALRPFDLGRGPLARWTLLRLDEAEHALLVTFHHAVSDAESTPILVRELVELYAASVTGRPAELPALPIQYGDYAVWQRRWLAGEVLQAQIDHWKSELAGAPTVVELPFDRSRPPHPSYRGAAVVSRLDAELTGALNAVARRGETTLFMTLAAVYGALLERFTGQDDLLVGVPAAQRSRAELEDLIGFFINTLALRLELGGQPSWSEFLVRVRRRALAAYAHQELPFDRLVEDLRLERDSRRAPLVQALIQLIEVPPAKLEPSGLAITVFGAEKRVAKFDLTLNLRQSEDGLTATWLYATDLFDATTIRRLAEGWTRLIEALAEDPDSRVGAASLMRPAERHQLLAELGGAPARGPAAALLPARFAARAAQCPEAIAVVCGERQLSYGELARRAAGLARQLAAHGAGPEVLVGLCLERSERIAVAILGVLATGAAYLPLDPSYPRERLEFTLTDAAAKVVVTDPEHAERVAGDGRTVVVLGETACDPAALAPPELDAESAAYVIYTSGSTGRPKGVVITHAQVARLFGAALPWVDFGADEVWTLFHSYAFDFSVWELWGALLGGARLVVVPFDISRSPALFHDLLARERVSSLSQTPTAFQQLIAADGEPAADRLSLRRVYFGGEALEIGMLAPWFARHDDSSPQLVNLYGITETTVHASWRPLGLGDEPGGGSPIGGPLADLELHLLDHRGRLVPWGVAGEIHVSGGGVARGYDGRPGLTASRFVPHPWSEVAGARLYRSGDLARRRPSGELETLGRIDHQVKLRGFRIELGEIEAVLAAIPEVSAVTVGLDTSAGEPRLVAWTVTTASAAELKKAAAEVLPGYMVPAAIVLLEALPRTPEGKLDRRALPAPEALDREPAAGFVTPRDALEARLADLWGEVLGIERVGAEDNFFEFGGDSIRGAILINRLQAVLGAIVHVVAIFDAPTPAAMAALLRRDYTAETARLDGGDPSVVVPEEKRADRAQIAQLRALIEPLPPAPEESRAESLNPQAIFVLAPPRSGTTLFRVLLSGHPKLFAPPELELLSWRTLAERRKAFSGRDAFWLEGVLRAVMASHGLDAEAARAVVAGYEREGWSTRRFYGWLQAALGERLLVDKTPSYTLDLSILERAESEFSDARYLHLVRHPGGMIRSFEEARLDQLFFHRQHPWSTRRLAELLWNVGNENVLRFLQRVPGERQQRVAFEELVQRPRAVLEEVCDFLGMEFDPAMLEPYADARARMTDGLHAASKMLGDVKFHQHRKIDPATAEGWRSSLDEAELGAPTWALARRLGYSLRTAVAMPSQDWRPVGGPRSGALPLSFAQQRLWFIDQLEPGKSIYNMPSAMRLKGEVRAPALAAAFTEVVRRHESLRTRFLSIDGEPAQEILPAMPLALPIIDLQALPKARGEAEMQRLLSAQAARAFDLAQGSLIRAVLVRLGIADHVLSLTMHHIACDGWSMAILIREMVTLYEAFTAGEPSPLPELEIQYADYAIWQRRWLTGDVLEAHLSYWRRHLGGDLPLLDLPFARPRPARPSFRGGRCLLDLPGDLSDKLAALNRQRGVTLFMTLLAALEIQLARYTGQESIIVGMTFSNRNLLETEDLIGCFLNTLPLRIDFADVSSFPDLLSQVKEVTLGAFAHQDLPLEKLVEEIRPRRYREGTPLFQMTFGVQNAPREILSFAGIESSPVHGLGVDDAKFDLTIWALETPRGLRIAWTYSRDLFAEEDIVKMHEHFGTLLRSIVREPEAPIDKLEMYSATEKEQFLRQQEIRTEKKRKKLKNIKPQRVKVSE